MCKQDSFNVTQPTQPQPTHKKIKKTESIKVRKAHGGQGEPEPSKPIALIENCMFYVVKPSVFMKTIDFAEAVPSFWQKPQILLGRSQKNAKKTKSQRKSLRVSGASQDFLWDLGFFEFFGDPNKIWGFCQKDGTASAKSMVFLKNHWFSFEGLRK